MFCYNPAPVRLSMKELGDERDGGENKRKRGVQKRGFHGEPVWNFIFNTHKHGCTRTHTHTHKYKAQWGLKCGPAPLISLLLSCPDAVPPSWLFVSFTPSLYLLNTILCLWFCLNLFRMHLDISSPGRIGEIEGVRMRESRKNREWLRERGVNEVLSEMTCEQR